LWRLYEIDFVIKNATEYSIRYFTPTLEVPLCGHATLGAAFILWAEGLVPQNEAIVFQAKGGKLTAKYQKAGIQLDFPAAIAEPFQGFDKNNLKKLSINPTAIYQSGNDIVYELASENEVKNFQPDFQFMKILPFRMHIITAKAAQEDVNFISRVFAPTAGIDEDPATGIAHCILGPLWAEKLKQKTMKAFQASKRGAQFVVTIVGERVQLLGQARLILKGDFYV